MASKYKNPLASTPQKKDAYGGMPPLDYNLKETTSDGTTEACYCSRPQSSVFCVKCGHVFTGRANIQCPRHPRVIHLMDTSFCPACGSSHLKEY